METEERYYDIHTHLIPYVDDGAKDVETTRKMLRIAYEDGIRTIIATPHFIVGRSCKKEKLLERFQILVEEANKISSEFKIYLGNELYYSSGIVEQLQSGEAFTMADSKYILVEFSVAETFRKMKEGIQDLMMSGYRPILAHIERYQCLRELDNVRELAEAGCYLQVNASSFLGNIFDKRARYCKKLITSGYVHLVGSDCHNIDERKPMISKSYQYLSKFMNRDTLDEIFYHNPQKIIENKYI